MLKLISLIFRNVFRNKRRTILTLASMAVSLALLSLLMALYQSFFHGEDSSPSEALRLICRHRVSLTQSLPASHQARIAAIPGVVEVSAWSWYQGVYIDQQNFFARFAVDADRIFKIRQDWTIPAEQVEAFKRDRTGCVVGEAIAKKYNMKIGDKINIKGDIYPVDLELTLDGIFKHPPNNEVLVFQREYLDELMKTVASRAGDTVGTYAILTDTLENSPRIAKAIDAMFDNSPYPTRTESEKEFGRSFLAFFGNVKLFLMAICGAVTFTILLVSANTIAMAVRERTREMAILRTLGYTPGEILQLILGESVVISVLGGLVGLALGYFMSKGMLAVAGGFGFQGLKWQAALAVLAVAAVIGLLASLVPAVFASRKNVVESLRFTG